MRAKVVLMELVSAVVSVWRPNTSPPKLRIGPPGVLYEPVSSKLELGGEVAALQRRRRGHHLKRRAGG